MLWQLDARDSLKLLVLWEIELDWHFRELDSF